MGLSAPNTYAPVLQSSLFVASHNQALVPTFPCSSHLATVRDPSGLRLQLYILQPAVRQEPASRQLPLLLCTILQICQVFSAFPLGRLVCSSLHAVDHRMQEQSIQWQYEGSHPDVLACFRWWSRVFRGHSLTRIWQAFSTK